MRARVLLMIELFVVARQATVSPHHHSQSTPRLFH
jgi:hypothetical protein